MNVCIVGHGPSLKGAKKGKYIDSHDYVVRIKKGQNLTVENPEDYGKRIDAVIASTEVLGCFSGVRAQKWGYPKYGWYDEVAASDMGVAVPLNLCNFWNWQFRNLLPKHPNYSTGFAAVVIAAHQLRPKVISLGGFDTLLDPKKPFTRITEVPRTGSGDFPNHDWEKENALLGKISEAYGVEITAL